MLCSTAIFKIIISASKITNPSKIQCRPSSKEISLSRNTEYSAGLYTSYKKEWDTGPALTTSFSANTTFRHTSNAGASGIPEAMADFIELGIEASDKLIDKHFDKVPDAALHAHTYHPKNLKKVKSRRGSKQDSQTTNNSKDSGTGTNTYRGSNMAQSDAGSQFGMPPQYSHEPPKFRPQYMPSPPPIDGYYAMDRIPRSDFGDDYYSVPYRRSPPRRPKAISRRSSSYHGPRNRDYDSESSDDDRQLARRRRNSMSNTENSRDHGHRHGFKEEIEKNFTKSPAGITGGVAGAIIGGWAAKKAQTASGRDRHGKGSSAAITVLGAALGGLAVNAIIDKMQDRKHETGRKEEKWEQQWGSEDEGDESNGERSSRRHRHRRERRDSRDSMGSGYRDDRGGRGYYD